MSALLFLRAPPTPTVAPPEGSTTLVFRLPATESRQIAQEAKIPFLSNFCGLLWRSWSFCSEHKNNARCFCQRFKFFRAWYLKKLFACAPVFAASTLGLRAGGGAVTSLSRLRSDGLRRK